MIKIAIGAALLITLVTFPLWPWFAALVLCGLYLFVLGMCRAASKRPEFLIERDTISREEWQARRYSAQDIVAIESEQSRPFDQEID